MRPSLMLPFLFAIGVTASAAAVAQDEAGSKLSLTRAEWHCLQARLDQYLRDKMDPALASVFGCERSLASGAAPPIRRDPIIAPSVGTGSGADTDAARKVFFLTLTQIRCLKEAIPNLIKDSGADKRIEYDLSACSSATP